MKTKILVIAVIFFSSFSFLACEKDDILPEPADIQDPTTNTPDTIRVDSVISYNPELHPMHVSNFSDFDIPVTEENIMQTFFQQGNRTYISSTSISENNIHKSLALWFRYDQEGDHTITVRKYIIETSDILYTIKSDREDLIINKDGTIFIYTFYEEVLSQQLEVLNTDYQTIVPTTNNWVLEENKFTIGQLEIIVNDLNSEYEYSSLSIKDHKFISFEQNHFICPNTLNLDVGFMSETQYINNKTNGVLDILDSL